MVIAPNLQMEQLSLAYVRAVAANVGYQVTRPAIDNDSIDGILMARFGRRPEIHFQAKATTQSILQGGTISFPLPIKNYNELIPPTKNPRILIILLMPREQSDWLRQTTNELCLRRCAYWISLEGWPSSSNKSTVTIPIPVQNVFDCDQLIDLMQKTERGDTLC